jgi:hypothetical protein
MSTTPPAAFATDDGASSLRAALTSLLQEHVYLASGAFFEEITGGEIRADVLIPGLEEHVRTLTLAIDSIVAGDVAAAS